MVMNGAISVYVAESCWLIRKIARYGSQMSVKKPNLALPILGKSINERS